MKISLQEKIESQEKIIDELFSSIYKSKPNNETYFTSYFYKKLEELFKLEIYSLGLIYVKRNNRKNSVDFEIINNTDSQFSGALKTNKRKKPIITINTASKGYNMLKSENVEERIKGLQIVLKTLFHELRHLKQYLLIKNDISNKVVLRNAKEFAVIDNSSASLHKIYTDNHDSFAIEADADYSSISKRDNLSKDLSSMSDKYHLLITKSNRDINEIIVDNTVLDRDMVLDEIIDFLILKKKDASLLEKYPVLKKEYTSDFKKKDLSALFNSLNKEVMETIGLDIDKEEKNIIIKDIEEFYYELIYKRIDSINVFELYDAVNKYGREKIIELFNIMSDYFTQEKRRKINLVKDKYISQMKLHNSRGNFIEKNNGFIYVKQNNQIKLISSSDFVSKYISRTNNKILNLVLNSRGFKSRIPKYGYYILKNGTKVSVNTFINNIFLSEIQGKDPKFNMLNYYDKVVMKTCKSSYEVDFLVECEKINKQYQNQSSNIESVLSMKLLDNSVSLEQYKKLDKTLDLMKLIMDMDSDNFSSYLDGIMLCNLDFNNEDYYYSFNDTQLSFLNSLYKTATILNNSEVFNPKGIDYLDLLNNNPKIKEINGEIDKFNSINTSKSL